MLGTNNLDVNRTLERATVTKAILEVVHGLVEVEGYGEKEAVKDLLEFLDEQGYFSELANYEGNVKGEYRNE